MTKEEAIEYRRNYYLRNREKILAKYHEEAEKKRKKKHPANSDEKMLREWSRRLSERLEEEDLDDWLRWALELTRDANNRQIEKMNAGT